jgi:plasmid stabilization system protein ParE
MKVVYIEEALRNLDDISDYIRQNYPTISEAFRLRLQFVVARIAKWPESAQAVADQSGASLVAPAIQPVRASP